MATRACRQLLGTGHSTLRSAGPSRRYLHASRTAWQADTTPSSSSSSSNSKAPATTSSPPLPSSPSDSTARATNEAGPSRSNSNNNNKETNSKDEVEISYTTPGSVRYAQEDRKPLPFLSAPLGVKEKPMGRKLSFIEKRDRAFNQEIRMTKRKAIIKEAARGYFSDFHAMRSHGGKTWRAPNTLIKHERALYFPTIRGTCLSTGVESNTADILQGKVSIVCILTSVLSEQHTKSYYEAALDLYGKDSNFQLVQINLQENRLKAYVVSLFASSLKKTIPLHLQSTYLLSHQDLTMEREDLALHNKHVGYVYLVGPDQKIRWGGGAFAEKEERQAMIACTGVLLSRLSEENKSNRK